MNPTLETLSVEYGVAIEQITLWIERRWVRPDRCGDALAFSRADIARLRMIAEFRRDLAIDDDAMPVVLDLLDRLHAARARLHDLLQAVAELPEPARVKVLRRIQGETGS